MGNEGVSTKQLVKRIPSLNQVILRKADLNALVASVPVQLD